MIDVVSLCAFHAAYGHAIDNDQLERWPDFFTLNCIYRITNADNEREGLAAGIVYADSRDMLHDRIAALREANIYERHRYRHVFGMPLITASTDEMTTAVTPFLVARIMHSGETILFATGECRDRFVLQSGKPLLEHRVVVCDSPVTDTLLVLPL